MFSLKQLKAIRELSGQLSMPDDVRQELDNEIQRLEWQEIRQAEEEARRSAAIPQVVPNFRDIPNGTIVVRSEHWKNEHFDLQNKQIGIIVDMKNFEDDLCVCVSWPIIHWERAITSSLTHPLNVALKDGTVLPTITMNANQQAKPKTPA